MAFRSTSAFGIDSEPFGFGGWEVLDRLTKRHWDRRWDYSVQRRYNFATDEAVFILAERDKPEILIQSSSAEDFEAMVDAYFALEPADTL